jgi:hypothetical protein
MGRGSGLRVFKLDSVLSVQYTVKTLFTGNPKMRNRHAYPKSQSTGPAGCNVRLRAAQLLLSLLAITIILCQIPISANAEDSVLTFGEAALALNGPWRFQVGDNPQWADPNFNDASWETVDLTPKPGAHDGDGGLTNYTSGWSARGHSGYVGFAWYRMSVRVVDSGANTLWLAGPALVDNAYQLYVGGRLLGGIGDFSRTPPGVMAIQPRLFSLPRDLWVVSGQHLSTVIAFRVALLKGTSAATDGGGIHIAPVLGTESGVRNHYRLQWLEKAEAFAVDAAEPVFLLILAVMALSMLPFDPKDHFNVWIAAVLVLLGAAWFNQPLFWMAHFETLKDFVVWRLTIIDALLLGAWIMAWRAALGLQRLRWIGYACAGLTVMYLIARPLSTALLLPDLPRAVISGFATALKATRIGFLLLLLVVMWLGYSPRGRWLLFLSILTGSVTVFGRELNELGVPGIWFPYGVGLSRSECANAAFAAALFVYLIQRLWRFAPAVRRTGASGSPI